MRKRLFARVTISLVFLFTLFPTVSFCSDNSECKQFFKIIVPNHPELESITWHTASRGTILREYDAILVCENARAFLKTNVPFGREIKWRIAKGSFRGSISGDQMVILNADNAELSEGIVLRVEIEWIRGKVFYTRDQETIKKFGAKGIVFEQEMIKKQLDDEKSFLSKLRWRKAMPGLQLSAWQVIHVGNASNVEIEFSKGDAWVINRDFSQVGDKLTIPENYYLIIHPKLFSSARINSIQGNVTISNDIGKVESFFGMKGIIFIKTEKEE